MTPTEVHKRDAWRSAKSMLNEHGMPKAQTGTFLGKLAIDYGNDVLIEVIEAAILERITHDSTYPRL